MVRRRYKLTEEEKQEELALAKKLFGNAKRPSYIDSSNSDSEVEDHSSRTSDQLENDGIACESQLQEVARKEKTKPVWHDEDDEREEPAALIPSTRGLKKTTDSVDQWLTPKEYENRLRNAFSRATGSGTAEPKWAKRTVGEKKQHDSDSDGDSGTSGEDELDDAFHNITASAGRFMRKSKLLPKGIISVKKMNNITIGHRYGKRPMRVLQFHPFWPILMCAGENKVISLYKVGQSETEEAFLQDLRVRYFPISSAFFSADGQKIIAGSKRKGYLLVYDVCEGSISQLKTPHEMGDMDRNNMGRFVLSSDGEYVASIARNEIHLTTAASMDYVGVLTVPVNVSSAQFCPLSSTKLFALGENGQVFIWDIRNPKEQRSFFDDGGVRGTVIKLSKNGEFIACGSNTGIVNLYERSVGENKSFPKPVKAFDNLTTSADCLAFSKDSQILAFSSSVKNKAMRLGHVRSRSVFSNFPPRDAFVGKVTAVDISPNSKYLAVGDDRGYLNMFRLLHFDKY